jgi:hypothetical protein
MLLILNLYRVKSDMNFGSGLSCEWRYIQIINIIYDTMIYLVGQPSHL